MSRRLKVGINGFGQIGENVLKAILERKSEIDVVAINDLTEPRILAGLFRATSRRDVSYDTDSLTIDGRTIPITKERDPAKLDWRRFGDGVVVLESTGVFRSREKCAAHLTAGAARVLLSVPPDGDVDYMVVMGANEEGLNASHQVISNASCTTNSIAYPCRVLHEAFEIIAGFLTTIHSATNDQRVVDAVHSDLRRARATLGNIIPTSTGAARAIGKVYKPLNKRLDGGAIRVATPVGSVSVLSLVLDKAVTVDEVNVVLAAAAKRRPHLMAYLGHELDEVVLADIVGRPESAIIDPKETRVITGGLEDQTLVQISSWYDNVWGYSNRCVDLFEMFADW